METVLSLGQRVRLLRDHLELRQDEFGARVGISGNRISEIENGKGGTTASVLMSLCREFPVNPEWVLSGRGKMLKERLGSTPRAVDFGIRLNVLEEQMRRVLNAETDADPDPDQPLARVPLYMGAVPAGTPDMAAGEIEEYLDMPASWIRGKKNIYALKVNGDSMIDIGIMHGDTLLVEAREKAKHGQVVIASINGEVTVKTLSIGGGGAVSLVPENPAYRPIAITADMDFRILGIVLAAVRHYG
ncbi:MAG: helix-turn-helix domain-containing protein [Chlorobium sp.]|uniref:helix-turn-helix domain-containing protein n=1 Tax=Chlorobium sp. TaxID=1095 RepID=UPI0025BACA99|nr:S24 family peptidase [Chlorobium sp.]MCF8382440.1 helix-turn-helix domain-containing protein [Chlorobium sp.]